MKIRELAKVVKPSATKCNANDTIRRSTLWTTNGYWLIRSDLEPKFTDRLKTWQPLEDEKVQSILDKNKDVLNEMALENSLEIQWDTLMVRATCPLFNSKINACYLVMFAHLEKDHWRKITYHQSDPLSPFIIKQQGEVIGLVMPSH